MAEKLEDTVADLQKTVDKLATQVTKMAGKKLQAGLAEGEEMMTAASEGIHRAVKMGKAKTAEVNAMVEDNPWLAVAVVSVAALAVGHILGQATRKE